MFSFHVFLIFFVKYSPIDHISLNFDIFVSEGDGRTDEIAREMTTGVFRLELPFSAIVPNC